SSSIPIPDETFSQIANNFLSTGVSTGLLLVLWGLVIWRTLHDIGQRRKYKLDQNLVEQVFALVISTVGIGVAAYIFLGHKGIPYPVAIFALVAIAGAYALNNTKFGRRLYAIGGNEEAARLSGINVKVTTGLVFVIVGVLSAMAGIIQASRLDSATPNLGIMLELDVITAVVIGGTSLAGGSGTIGGTIIGVLLIGVLSNGMSLEGIDTNYQNIIKGLIIIIAVWFDVVSKRKKV
ncbi:MAG: inner-membrane translocator, partial [Myxococcota bacterium]